MIYITEIHMSAGGTLHEHIASFRWKNPKDNKAGVNDKATLVDWIETGGVAKVHDGTKDVAVVVVDAAPRYLRSKEDGYLTDNLLKLPRF